MSEPVNTTDPVKTDTPVVPATNVNPEPQPAITEPVVDVKKLQEDLEQERNKSKRYKEQLVGKDLLIDKFKVKKIAETLSPVKEPEVNVPVIEDKDLERQSISNIDIDQSMYINHLRMKDKFASDTEMPYTDDTRKEIETVLDELDPSGRVKKSPEAWETGYNIVRGKKAGEIAKAREEKVRQEYQSKEAAKITASVESTTPSAETPVGPTLEDVISGKVKMSTAEMVKRFPEVAATLPKHIRKQYGVV